MRDSPPATLQENNAKVFIEGRRYDKTQQPKGDPDCRLGCKRKTNQAKKAEGVENLPTLLKEAVPFVQRGGQAKRTFSQDGRPHCAADLAMILRYTYQCKTTLIPHQRSCYVCPLRFPKPSGETCPVQHKNWGKGGCVTTMAMSKGACLRYQIDRDSQEYKDIYKQRTATERVNSQAVEFGIERPKLRNAASIAHNTLTYVLINLHALQRVCQRKAERKQAVSA